MLLFLSLSHVASSRKGSFLKGSLSQDTPFSLSPPTYTSTPSHIIIFRDLVPLSWKTLVTTGLLCPVMTVFRAL